MNKPRFEIVQEDMGGWVRVFLGRGSRPENSPSSCRTG